MNEEEKLGDIIRQKLSEGDFEFDENNWKKAESMLPDPDKRKRRGFFIILFFVGVLSAGGWFLLFNGEGEKSTSLQTLTENKKVNTTENSTEVPAEKTNSVSTTKASQHLTETEHSQVIEKSGNNSPEKISAATTTVQNNLLSEKNTSTKNKPAQKHTLQNNTLSANNKKLQKNSSVAIAKTKKDKSGTKKNQDNINLLANENPKGPDLVNATNKGLIKDSIVQTNSAVKKDSLPVIAETDKLNTKKPDSTEVATQNNEKKTVPKSESNPQIIIAAEAGSNFMYGWLSGGVKEGKGFNPLLGLNFTRGMGPKLAASLGLQVTTTGNLGYSSYTAVNTKYSFGVSSTTTTITPKRLYQLAVPLKLFFMAGKKNMIGVGGNVSCLFNTMSRVEIANSSTLEATSTQRSTSNGYMKGFRTLDFQATLNYRRQLKGNFGLNAELFFGLTDLKKNDFFNANSFERLSGLKLTLYYNIVNQAK